MSLCLIVRDKGNLWIGADTAVSADIDGIPCRVANDYCEKVFVVGNDIIFCSGLLMISDKVKEHIEKSGYIDVFQIQLYLRQLVASLPFYLKGDDYETGIIICKGDGEIISLTQAENFEAVVFPAPKGIQILSGGFNSDKAEKIAGSALRQNRGIFEIFGETYQSLASDIIGGNLILYHHDYQLSTITRYDFTIKEPVTINFFEGTVKHCRFNGVVQASDYQDLYGRSMMSSYSTTSTGAQKFGAEYLDLLGLNVNNNFIVDRNGNVTVRGDINMTGGSISWGNINESGSQAYQTANSAYSLANTANTAAANVRNAVNALESGLGYTYINGQYVISPNIIGGTITGAKIEGGRYYNTQGTAYLYVGNQSYGDFDFYGNNGNKIFSIYDSIGSTDLKSHGTSFLVSRGSSTSALGTWSFDSATVTGITATFA